MQFDYSVNVDSLPQTPPPTTLMIIIKSKRILRFYKHTINRLLLQFRITTRKRKKRNTIKFISSTRLLFVTYPTYLQRKNVTQIRMGSGNSNPHRRYYLVYPNTIFMRIKVYYFYSLLIFLKKLTRFAKNTNVYLLM